MDTQKFGQKIFLVGVAGMAGSAFLWLIFYLKVFKTLGGQPSDVFGKETLECLIWNSDHCRVFIASAIALGEFAYQPMFLWVSCIVGLIGAGMMESSTQ